MKGFLYRLGCRIKDLGERRGWRFLVNIGLAVRDKAARLGGGYGVER